MLCSILILAFKDKASLILALLSIFPGVGLYYSVLYFIRERQLLFDDEGIHNVYKQKGERIVESIPWNQITKIEYWGNYGGKPASIRQSIIIWVIIILSKASE